MRNSIWATLFFSLALLFAAREYSHYQGADYVRMRRAYDRLAIAIGIKWGHTVFMGTYSAEAALDSAHAEYVATIDEIEGAP
jgi:hypothetical protein